MAFESKYVTVEQYLRKISGQEKEPLNIDHNYVKPWNAHPDSNRTKPARQIFMKGLHLQRYPPHTNENEEIDVESVEEEPLTSPFDNQRFRMLANECERNLKFSSHFSDVEREEEELDVNSCNPDQRSLYQKVTMVLNTHRLAKLACSGTVNEPLKRRIETDKAARQLRQIFGMIRWDIELLSWLHKQLLKSNFSILPSYIDVLQTLRAKLPTLVDRILQDCVGFPANDAVMQIMKRPWDPVVPILSQNKLKKLPGNPIILICPSSPNQQLQNSRSPRLRFWHSNLSSMCKVMNIPMTSDDGKTPSTVDECLEQIVSSVRNKVTELKNHYPNRPLILLGWTTGGLIACHIALQAPVDAIVSLGFPLTGVNGSRGDLNDPLLDNSVPTLFIVGQYASTCLADDIEDFRSRMRAETSLVLVGGADDFLRMCPESMKQESVTQPMVDRCLLDEINEFLMSVVAKAPSTSAVAGKICTPILEEEHEQLDQDWKPEDEGKRRRRKPREYSPELSPVRKRPRHHTTKQVSSASHKARLSPTTSESSSSGNEKHRSKSGRKLSEKRSRRPSVANWRKRQASKALRTPKSLQSTNHEESSSKKTRFENVDEAPSRSNFTKEIPFSKNILPKKNDPVDVEMAFGKDSIFLPRPLTPPEPEDTVSAEETEEVLAELEALAKEPSLHNDAPLHDPPIKEVTFSTILDQPIKNSIVEGAKLTSFSAAIASVEESKSTRPSTPPMQTVFPPSKFFSSTPLSSLKSSGSVSLLASNQSTPSTPTATKSSTLITVPSPSAATLLVSNSNSNQPKMIQVVKGSLIARAHKIEVPSRTPSDQQPCNLSLLSDVAGMTEQLSRKPEVHTTTSATLVKLAASDRNPFLNMKCLKVVKSAATPTTPMRVETTEEMIEKQMAIQALNKSIGAESAGPSKESGYSICYKKADGTVVSHTITRPTQSTTVSKPNISTLIRGRGRGKSIFSSNPFKMFDM